MYVSSVVCVHVGGFFFFQAEDGIRDLVRSRGLGDVYKRQASPITLTHRLDDQFAALGMAGNEAQKLVFPGLGPVSYTHLTLPTSDLV